MNNQEIYMLNSTGRQVFPFPWVSRQLPCPWNNETHMRVMLPLTELERRNSNKKCHTQIVRRSKITTLHGGFKKMPRRNMRENKVFAESAKEAE